MGKKDYLISCDRNVARLINAVGQAADQRGVSAYVVGGVIRDLLLGKNNCDLDIVLEGDVSLIGQNLAKKLNSRFKYYPQFQTGTLIAKKNIRIDLTTARKERYARSGALPQVTPGTLRDDLFRRDFTINAMAISINKANYGDLRDEFDGMNDLKSKKIRILHPQSFVDDPTRIFRAIRFEQRLSYRMERATLLLIKRAVDGKVINNVTSQRILAELKKILLEDYPLRPLKRFNQLKLFRFLSLDTPFDIRLLSSVYSKVRKMETRYKYLQENDKIWLIYLMALVEKMDSKSFKKFFNRFSFSKGEKTAIVDCRQAENFLKAMEERGIVPSQVCALMKPLSLEGVQYLLVRAGKSKIRRMLGRFLDCDRNLQLIVTGTDLDRLGIPKGLGMGKILKEILNQKIDGKIKTKREELRLAQELAGTIIGKRG